MRMSAPLPVWLCSIALAALLSVPDPVGAAASKEYVAKFTFTNQQMGQRDALSFEVLGVLPKDLSVKILKGSTLQGPITLDDLTTRTRVRVSGATRAVNNGQTADIEIRLKNKKEARIADPRWGVLQGGVVPVPLPPLGKPKITGGKWALDPQFTAFNDTDEPFGVRNLELFTNVSPVDFEALDPHALLADDLDSLLPSFFLSPGTSTIDLGLSLDIFPEPNPGLFLVAIGQIVDESGTVVGAFIHGVQAEEVPQPAALVLVGAGGLGLWAARLGRRHAVLRRRTTLRPASISAANAGPTITVDSTSSITAGPAVRQPGPRA